MQFHAKTIVNDEFEDCECFIVGFSEDPQGEGLSFQMQISLNEDPVAGLLDNFCIVDSSHSVFFGGLRQCTLSRTRFDAILTDEAAEEMGYAFCIATFDALSDEQYQLLRVGIARLLGASPVQFTELLREDSCSWLVRNASTITSRFGPTIHPPWLRRASFRYN